MNNIYVDEQPESCLDCEFCIKRNYCCILMQKDVREYRDDCPLIPLTDRLAEERKKVVQKIKQRLCKVEDTLINLGNGKEDALNYFVKILDQIERGVK